MKKRKRNKMTPMTRSMPKNVMAVRLHPQHIDELAILANKEGLARCSFLRKVVEEYLSKKNHAADKVLAA